MTGDFRKHLDITPFVPFSIRTADGLEHPVPMANLVYLPPTFGRVVISDEYAIIVVLPGLLISGLMHAATPHKKANGA